MDDTDEPTGFIANPVTLKKMTMFFNTCTMADIDLGVQHVPNMSTDSREPAVQTEMAS